MDFYQVTASFEDFEFIPVSVDHPENQKDIINLNDKDRPSNLHFAKMLAKTILRTFTTFGTLVGYSFKLITWDLAKAAIYKIGGYHTEASEFLLGQYLDTVKALRDFVFIPSIAMCTFLDMVTCCVDEFVDDIERKPPNEYINEKVACTKSYQDISSHLYGRGQFEVLHPEKITEFPAVSDPNLKTVMASHIFKPGTMAIIFGTPNVASFVVEETEDPNHPIQTTKVDAKSLWREDMHFHPTNGKIQTGVFLVPTNLPEEALERFKTAAKNLEGTKNVTCVNTNCQVLQEAGFSIEGVNMDWIIFPQALVEALLFRNVFYTDTEGVKHKVHFDILNTTDKPLKKFFKDVDTAVVGTRFRHQLRHSDTEESKNARSELAKRLINEEIQRLAEAEAVSVENENELILAQRKVTISVPSCIAEIFANIWGLHTMYELDLSDKQEEIAQAFQDFETPKLRPFPQEDPDWFTWIKKNIAFSEPMIHFLRRHMMGHADVAHLSTQGIFQHLKSMNGERLNYALLDNKLVVSKVHANGDGSAIHEKAADWALSKHALLANREEVYCSGEIWYDEAKDRFVMNDDSGTYLPSFERLQVVVNLANAILGDEFEAYQKEDEKTSIGDDDVDTI